MTADPKKLRRCVVIGETALVTYCLRLLAKQGFSVVQVISPDPAVVDRAKKAQIPSVLYRYPHFPFELLKAGDFEYIFSIVNFKVIPKDYLNLPGVLAINYHDAPLPKYGGTHATSWALINGEKAHGVTWHLVTEGIDEGPILKQEVIPIEPRETAQSLDLKCFYAAQRTLSELLADLSNEQVRPLRPAEGERSYFPRHKRPGAAGLIDEDAPGEKTDALFRALHFGRSPNPLCLPKILWRGQILYPAVAELSEKSTSPPGTIVSVDSGKLRMATATRDLIFQAFRDDLPKGLAAGQAFERLPSRLRADITGLHEEAAVYERYWKRRLAAQKHIAEPKAGANLHERVVHALAQAKTSDILYGHTPATALQGRDPVFERLFATYLPLAVSFSLQESYADLEEKWKLAEAAAVKKITFLRDIVFRYPELACEPQPIIAEDRLNEISSWLRKNPRLPLRGLIENHGS